MVLRKKTYGISFSIIHFNKIRPVSISYELFVNNYLLFINNKNLRFVIVSSSSIFFLSDINIEIKYLYI